MKYLQFGGILEQLIPDLFSQQDPNNFFNTADYTIPDQNKLEESAREALEEKYLAERGWTDKKMTKRRRRKTDKYINTHLDSYTKEGSDFYNEQLNALRQQGIQDYLSSDQFLGNSQNLAKQFAQMQQDLESEKDPFDIASYRVNPNQGFNLSFQMGGMMAPLLSMFSENKPNAAPPIGQMPSMGGLGNLQNILGPMMGMMKSQGFKFKKGGSPIKTSYLGYKKNSPDKNANALLIPGNRITMKDVDPNIPAIALIPDKGQPVIAQNGGAANDYYFPEAKYVVEFPLENSFGDYEDDYLKYKKGGGIHIKEKNRGKFTEAAKRAGMGVQEYARHVLANKDNFARNTSKWKHQLGSSVNPYDALFELLDEVEARSDYDALWNNMHKKDGPFKGMKVTEMTLDEVRDLQKKGSKYYKSVAKQNKGRGSTPVGRLQIVGTTLDHVANKLGMDGDMLFDKNTQRAMGMWLANNRIRRAGEGASIKDIREQLTKEWVGLSKIDRKRLDPIIKGIVNNKYSDEQIMKFATKQKMQKGGPPGSEADSVRYREDANLLDFITSPFDTPAKIVRNRAIKNTVPAGYSNYIGRVEDNIINDVQDPHKWDFMDSEYYAQFDPTGKYNLRKQKYIREDALRLGFGEPPIAPEPQFEPSPYTPSESDRNWLERAWDWITDNEPQYKRVINPDWRRWTEDHIKNAAQSGAALPHYDPFLMGHQKWGMKEDEDGRLYLSLYDKWDFVGNEKESVNRLLGYKPVEFYERWYLDEMEPDPKKRAKIVANLEKSLKKYEKDVEKYESTRTLPRNLTEIVKKERPELYAKHRKALEFIDGVDKKSGKMPKKQMGSWVNDLVRERLANYNWDEDPLDLRQRQNEKFNGYIQAEREAEKTRMLQEMVQKGSSRNLFEMGETRGRIEPEPIVGDVLELQRKAKKENIPDIRSSHGDPYEYMKDANGGWKFRKKGGKNWRKAKGNNLLHIKSIHDQDNMSDEERRKVWKLNEDAGNGRNDWIWKAGNLPSNIKRRIKNDMKKLSPEEMEQKYGKLEDLNAIAATAKGIMPGVNYTNVPDQGLIGKGFDPKRVGPGATPLGPEGGLKKEPPRLNYRNPVEPPKNVLPGSTAPVEIPKPWATTEGVIVGEGTPEVKEGQLELEFGRRKKPPKGGDVVPYDMRPNEVRAAEGRSSTPKSGKTYDLGRLQDWAKLVGSAGKMRNPILHIGQPDITSEEYFDDKRRKLVKQYDKGKISYDDMQEQVKMLDQGKQYWIDQRTQSHETAMENNPLYRWTYENVRQPWNQFWGDATTQVSDWINSQLQANQMGGSIIDQFYQMGGAAQTGPMPGEPVMAQLEKNEKIIMPGTNSIVDTKATKYHKDMSDTEGTDYLPAEDPDNIAAMQQGGGMMPKPRKGAYVLSQDPSMAMTKDMAENYVIKPKGPYDYDTNEPTPVRPEETMAMFWGKTKGKMVPAKLGSSIARRYPEFKKAYDYDKPDLYQKVASDSNLEAREPAINGLIAMSEAKKQEVENEEAQSGPFANAKYGGYPQKHQFGEMIGAGIQALPALYNVVGDIFGFSPAAKGRDLANRYYQQNSADIRDFREKGIAASNQVAGIDTAKNLGLLALGPMQEETANFDPIIQRTRNTFADTRRDMSLLDRLNNIRNESVMNSAVRSSQNAPYAASKMYSDFLKQQSQTQGASKAALMDLGLQEINAMNPLELQKQLDIQNVANRNAAYRQAHNERGILGMAGDAEKYQTNIMNTEGNFLNANIGNRNVHANAIAGYQQQMGNDLNALGMTIGNAYNAYYDQRQNQQMMDLYNKMYKDS